MIPFDPNDPFPLLGVRAPYKDEQAHSAQVDAWLGLEVERVERGIVARGAPKSADDDWYQERWIGLEPQALLTPYSELRGLLALLSPRPGSRVVDLGAAYGRMGFVIGRHHSELAFLGYELVEERVLEGQRCLTRFNYPNVKLETRDLGESGFIPAEAEIYFIYDFGSRLVVTKAIEDLKQIAARRPITVIGRGRGIRDRVERSHPWLTVHPPQHHPRYSIYRS